MEPSLARIVSISFAAQSSLSFSATVDPFPSSTKTQAQRDQIHWMLLKCCALVPQEDQAGPYGWATLHAHVREVGILISNHTMRQGDRGSVIVGSSVDLGEMVQEPSICALAHLLVVVVATWNAS